MRAPGGKIKSYSAFRIGLLLSLSASAVFLALLPFAFEFAGLSSGKIWTLSSSAMVVLVGTFQIVTFRLHSVLAPAAPEDRPPGLRFVVAGSAAALIGVNVLQLANAAWLRELWPFYVGLLTVTMYSLFQFAYLLFAPAITEVEV